MKIGRFKRASPLAANLQFARMSSPLYKSVVNKVALSCVKDEPIAQVKLKLNSHPPSKAWRLANRPKRAKKRLRFRRSAASDGRR
eukprot:scaffold289030_cov31-Tisochrysis_lutea.AAC.1